MLHPLGRKFPVGDFRTLIRPLVVCFEGDEKIFGWNLRIVGVLLARTLSYEAVCIG